MPAADPMSRGARKGFKNLTSENGDHQGPARDLRDVVNGTELTDLVADLIELGHALTVGRTRDGGAISLAFMVGGKPIKRYIASRDAWVALLAELAD